MFEVQLFPKARDFLKRTFFGSPKMIRSSASRSMVSFPRPLDYWMRPAEIHAFEGLIKGPPAALVACCVLLATNT